MRYEIEAEVWLWTGGKASWRFVTLPAEVCEGIRRLSGPRTGGWGSLRVAATIGATTWRTSIFPDSKSGGFLLPLKAEVRQRERIATGDVVTVAVEIEL